MPADTDDSRKRSRKSRSEKLIREYISRRDSGEDVTPEEYLTKYPELEKDLKELFNRLKAEGAEEIDMGEGHGAEAATPPDTIGDFKIIRELGSGGMGTVYEAEQLSLKRKVALKVLPAHLGFSDQAVLKFKREAEAGGRQQHPGIVAIHSVGEDKGVHYIAQELVEEGRTLADRLDELRGEKGLPAGYFREAAALFAEIADALEHAHSTGVVHRDVKPQNILLTQEGAPKVTDFGLAKVEDALALSRTGDFAGTPYYMSPEQAASKRIGIDHKTDIFSLGATLYEMLTLKIPFEGDTSQQVLKKILLDDPTDPRKLRSRVPRDLSVICLKAMEKKPERRYRSMEDFAADIHRFLNNESILAKPPGALAGGVKWVKRYPVFSASAAVAMLALVAITCLFLYALSERDKAQEQGRIADQQRKVAEAEKKRALAAEMTAEGRALEIEQNLAEIMRLSDLKILSDLVDEEDELWPAHPENIPGLDEWIKKAEKLVTRLDEHQRVLDTLRGDATPYTDEHARIDRESHLRISELLALQKAREDLFARIESMKDDGSGETNDSGEGGTANGEEKGKPEEPDNMKKNLAELDAKISEFEKEVSKRRTYIFDNIQAQWRHDTLSELVSGVLKLSYEEDGLLKSVKERLVFAETIKKRSIDDHRSAWDEAIASIADEEECPAYKGLVIEEQLGLVPIGRDPESGLWEFSHLQTGTISLRDTEGKLFLAEDTGIVFVLIPGGSFDMGAVPPSEENPEGSPNVDPNAERDEGPVHEKSIKPFYLSKYEMTQGQWLRFTKKNPSFYGPDSIDPSWSRSGQPGSLLHPVEQVNWEDCAELAHRLRLRFPSESEWEYACRAGTTSVFCTGNNVDSLQGSANLCDLFFKENGGPPTWTYEENFDDGYAIHAPVGSFVPNAFGLHDVHGNVFEWCSDAYHFSYEGAPADGSSWESTGSSYRVFRGGSWDFASGLCRSAYRSRLDPGLRNYLLGFRPALFLAIE